MTSVARLALTGGILLTILASACAAAPAQRATGDRAASPEVPARTKILTLAISQPVTGFAHVSGPAGGWMQITEIHSDGLVTSEFSSRRTVGRLAENVPTVEDGTLSVLPDGRMRALFRLRKGVTWHD